MKRRYSDYIPLVNVPDVEILNGHVEVDDREVAWHHDGFHGLDELDLAVQTVEEGDAEVEQGIVDELVVVGQLDLERDDDIVVAQLPLGILIVVGCAC